jgi:hypothetical protein
MKKDLIIIILAVCLALAAWPLIDGVLGDTGRFIVGIGIIVVIMLSRFNIKPSMPKMGKQQWKPPKQQQPQQHRGQPPRQPGYQQPQPQFNRGQQQGQPNQNKQRGMPQQGRPQQQQQQFNRGQPHRQQYPQQQRRPPPPPQQQYQVPYAEDYEDEEYYEE